MLHPHYLSWWLSSQFLYSLLTHPLIVLRIFREHLAWVTCPVAPGFFKSYLTEVHKSSSRYNAQLTCFSRLQFAYSRRKLPVFASPAAARKREKEDEIGVVSQT